MSSKTSLTVLGAFVVIWAVLGFLDVGNFTYTGYTTDFDNNVATVAEGGPADAAGMEVGDKIRSIDGISSEDVRALSSQPRAKIGQTQTMGVDRDGQSVELTLTHAALPSSQNISSYIGILIGLVFCVMGLWAFLTVPTGATHLLAMSGILFAIPFTGGPYLGTSLLSSIVGGVIFFCIVMAFAVLLNFMIIFPRGSEPDRRWVYGPAALVGLFVLGLGVFQPNATSALNRVVQFVFFLWIVGYLGLVLFKMVRTWAAASADHRDRHGLNTLLIGTGLGLGILLVSAVIGLLLPSVTIPGSQWFGVALVLVPISCAVAAVKSGRAAEGTATMEPAPAAPEA